MIVLDTHVLVWWVSGAKELSRKAGKRIEKEAKTGEILVSSISVWEITMLVQKGRLKLTMDVARWIAEIEKLPFIEFVPVDNTIAAKSVTLPEPFHSDPADRMVIATAREYAATLVTSDKRIRSYPHVQSLW